LEIRDVLVVGLGEIGAPLLDIVQEVYHAEGLDVEPKEVRGSVDILHVCFPYDEKFVETTVDYMKRFQPKLTLIESTVLRKESRRFQVVLLCLHQVRRANDG